MQILWIQKDFPFVADLSGHYMSLQYCKMPFAECSHGLRKVLLTEMWLKVSKERWEEKELMWLKVNKERWEEKELRSIKVQILLLAPLKKYIL